MERWLALLYPEQANKAEKTGLTKKQRDWIKRCYSDENGIVRCHFPVWEGDKWRLCGSSENPQANHIIPQGYAREVLFWTSLQTNNPYNLIINCARHHLGDGYNGTLEWREHVVPVYHPDNTYARRRYKGTVKPTSYDKVFAARHSRVERGETYWNVGWTDHLLQIAQECVGRYTQRHPLDKWPAQNKPHKLLG